MLNKEKPYGECGANVYGWKYYQDGKYFNSQMNEVDNVGNVIEATLVEAGTAPVAAEKEKPIPRQGGRRKVVQKGIAGAKK